MAKNTLTLRKFQDRFPTEESCLEHLKLTRFGERHECEKCGKDAQFYRVQKRRSYACEHCGHQIYPTAGTPFHRTRTSLRDWFYVMFLFCTTRNGVAAKEVERQIGVTYKTAWRMCHEVRKYMAQIDGDEPVGGEGKTVEVDETMIGGALPALVAATTVQTRLSWSVRWSAAVTSSPASFRTFRRAICFLP